jgi:hypothetical protein
MQRAESQQSVVSRLTRVNSISIGPCRLAIESTIAQQLGREAPHLAELIG